MTTLITGGAGYIGSHTALALRDAGKPVVILDDISTGFRQLLPEGIPFVEGDIGDSQLLQDLFQRYEIKSVMHFAARSLVGQSMKEPGTYFLANSAKTATLIQAMVQNNVGHFILSSTAAVYGEPTAIPIDENHVLQPTNPYGLSKKIIEDMLPWFEKAHGLKWISLRYFNAAGADPQGRSGEIHDPETHLIPNILKVALEEKEALQVFGNDYPTPDGTCIRDYVHVTDLAKAHMQALDFLLHSAREEKASGTINLGSGSGYSVLEVIETARRITGHPIPVQWCPRRPGDPAILVASNKKAKEKLNWNPKHTNLESIIQTAWDYLG
ncbi:UDP-glucose 4-epimerase GalE [Heliorestis acidaminivorans]|uniref:UDP-glucose 4-epimerase n=1 Tax=Heliorestis acidaminivorans TaxID=553427 RepID=A0A6I0EUX9_9FIRM|nr:UDP-glucose 4-epimerase GalE [Heliorestis acidaminivorans]KAB2951638.1 UDP-glucose 4-epimerase GalE [Heliorestis acidaminivorans]